MSTLFIINKKLKAKQLKLFIIKDNMRHNLNLHPEPFAAIKTGLKTIEMRLNDERRRLIKVGDEIEFTNRETNETMLVDVVDIIPFESFDELYTSFDKHDLGYKDDEVANPNDMAKYYSEEQRQKYGALAIKIRRK